MPTDTVLVDDRMTGFEFFTDEFQKVRQRHTTDAFLFLVTSKVDDLSDCALRP
jgi:hypothetical protein